MVRYARRFKTSWIDWKRAEPHEYDQAVRISKLDEIPPPIIQFYSNGNVGIPDGFHRVAAYYLLGRDKIEGYKLDGRGNPVTESYVRTEETNWPEYVATLMEEEQEGEPTPHKPKGPGGGQFTAKPGGGEAGDEIKPSDLPSDADDEDEDDNDEDEDDDEDDEFDYDEPADTLASGKHALTRFAYRSEDDIDKSEHMSIELHDLTDDEDAEDNYLVITYIDNKEFDRDGYTERKDAIARQKEISSDFRQLAKDTEKNYRDGLADAMRSVGDSASSKSPEHGVARCLAKQFRAGKSDAVQAALRSAGICK